MGPGEVIFDGQPDNDIDNGEEGAKKQERESDVEHTLPESVFGKTERLLADAEYGTLPRSSKYMRASDSAHVGDTEKAYQVIFAIVDDGENLFAAGRRQATINLLDSSLLQAVHNLTGFSQIVHLFGEAAAGLVVKVADDTESGSDVVRHLMVEFDYIAIASHQNDAAGVASMLTIGLQDLAEQ